MNRTSLRVFGLLSVLLVLGFGLTQAAAAEVAVIYSTRTQQATANYPTYDEDFQALAAWMEPLFEFDVITDDEALTGALNEYKLAILPNNGVMSAADVSALEDFVRMGGKILAFYSTSLRTGELALVGYQIGGLLGLAWNQFTVDEAFDAIEIVEDHPALAKAPQVIPVGAKAVQDVAVVSGGRAVGVRASADGTASGNAVIVASDAGIFITNHMASATNLAIDEVQQLLISIITYYAPEAGK